VRHRAPRIVTKHPALSTGTQHPAPGTQHRTQNPEPRTPVYSTCLFCHSSLGGNESIEAFPVGRRLAFDQARGRLWVVCRACEKWNLSPLDERWDAIEDCERRFRNARKRVSSENIGLAKLNDGLELVRIGKPLRPEFAAWRYGDQFGRRRRKALLVGGGLAAAGAGLVVAATATGVLSGMGYLVWQGAEGVYNAARDRRVVAHIPAPRSRYLVVRGKHLKQMCLHTPGPGQWGLHVPHDRGVEQFVDEEARRAAAFILPRLNASGASIRRVRAAVHDLESVGSPQEFLLEVARQSAPKFVSKTDHGLLRSLHIETRLAIEMAVNEENERAALEGELELLEAVWKEAEEIAAISDTLGLPEEMDRQLAELKGRKAI